MLIDLFSSKNKETKVAIHTDIHSHLLPGIDDGVQTVEESVRVIQHLSSIGFKKIITTPHIMYDYYRNTPEIIRAKLEEVKKAVILADIPIEIVAAAEYYLDENFLKKINKGEELLTFGDKYILFETSFIVEPLLLKEIIFKLKSNGYKPVYAHPERYLYLYKKKQLIDELIDLELLFQINILSLIGYYSKQVKEMANELIKRGAVSFIGSDCHNLSQAIMLDKAYSSNIAQKIDKTKLLNHEL